MWKNSKTGRLRYFLHKENIGSSSQEDYEVVYEGLDAENIAALKGAWLQSLDLTITPWTRKEKESLEKSPRFLRQSNEKKMPTLQ